MRNNMEEPAMNVESGYRCIVIGEGTLPQACAEILLQHGFVVVAVATGDTRFSAWAGAHAIACVDDPEALTDILERDGIDFLFSIVNPHILSPQMLAKVRRYALNYHDAPLPRYAGTCATAWALMAGEQRHAVSWHLMSGAVDSGDILAREDVSIASDDTSLTLNVKCYDAALRSFGTLAVQLKEGAVHRTAQDLSRRTFFANGKRPWAACTLDWREPAETLSALVRALHFGPYPNALGLAKFRMGGVFCAIDQLELLDTLSGALPGTILSLSAQQMCVATGSRDIALSGIKTLDGVAQHPATLASLYGLVVGARLPAMTEEDAAALDDAYCRAARHEFFWVQQWRQVRPFNFSGSRRIGGAGKRGSFASSVPGGRSPVSLLAAFGAYLARMGNAVKVDIGLQHAGTVRRHDGLFAHTVPLRMEFASRRPAPQVLEEVAQRVEEIRTRGSHAADLFMRYPMLRQGGAAEQRLPWPVAVRLMAENHPVVAGYECDLLLRIAPHGETLYWDYDTELFEPHRIHDIAAHFLAFIGRLDAAGAQCFGDIPLVDEKEATLLLEQWNDTAVDYPRAATIHGLFEQRAELQPDLPALTWGDQTLTYRELNEKANRLAHYLLGMGAARDTHVAICFERSMHTVIALLAILKAGAAYVPLDPSYPRERLAYMLADAQAVLLLTQEHLSALFSTCGVPMVWIDETAQAYASYSPANPAHIASAANLAYLTYTSGSTGQPKGVGITHQAVNRLVFDTRYLDLRASDVVAQAASSAFDAITFEIWGALLHGCQLRIVDYDIVVSPVDFAREINSAGITVLFVTTALFNQFAAYAPRAFAKVRVLLFGGEAVDRRSVEAILRGGAPQRLLHVYGPTESTTFSLFHHVQELAPSPATVAIGRPIANTQIYLLDSNLMPVPIGATGELYIGGDGLARGYLNRPDLTAEKFMANPFAATAGARMYKSGDLARYLPNGDIEYVGRVDHQVKIRGHRIEPGEIEATLTAMAAVRNAVVLVREDEKGDKYLIAYLTLHAGFSSTPTSTLRDALREKLPHYMIPWRFVLLDNMPLSSNGKVDRSALPVADAPLSHADYVAPTTALEEKLARIWARVLKVEQIGVRDNFFELGGHSLLATALMLTIRDELQVELPLRTMFEAPSVEALARKIAGKAQACEGEVPAQGQLPAHGANTGGSTPWSLEQSWISAGRNLSKLSVQPLAARSVFLVPGGGGSADVFHGVARGLVGNAVNVFVLHHDGVDNELPAVRDIHAIAGVYAQQMLTHGTGDIALAGYCIGGIIAHEMAKILAESGQKLRGMLFIDTPVAKQEVSTGFDMERAKCEFFKAICDVHARDGVNLAAGDFSGLSEEACIELTISAMAGNAQTEAMLWKNIFRRRYQAEIAHLLAIHGYWAHGGAVAMRREVFIDEIARADYPLRIFNTSESNATSWSPNTGLSRTNVIAEVVEGRHVTVLQDHADSIVRALLEHFDGSNKRFALAGLNQ